MGDVWDEGRDSTEGSDCTGQRNSSLSVRRASGRRIDLPFRRVGARFCPGVVWARAFVELAGVALSIATAVEAVLGGIRAASVTLREVCVTCLGAQPYSP